MAKYKIVNGSWWDPKAKKSMGPGDEVDFTEKQATVFGKSNLRSEAAAKAKAAEEAAIAADPKLAESLAAFDKEVAEKRAGLIKDAEAAAAKVKK